jgi:hypothetical protein
MEQQYQLVSTKTGELHRACEALLDDQVPKTKQYVQTTLFIIF